MNTIDSAESIVVHSEFTQEVNETTGLETRKGSVTSYLALQMCISGFRPPTCKLQHISVSTLNFQIRFHIDDRSERVTFRCSVRFDFSAALEHHFRLVE